MKKNDVEKMNVTVNSEGIENTEIVETPTNNSELPLVKRTYNNPELTSAVHKIGRTIQIGNAITWELAKICYNIAENKLWNKDFPNQAAFAESIGYKNATITGYKNAVSFINEHPELIDVDDEGNIVGGITVGKADVLSKIGDYNGFVTYCLEHEHNEPHRIGDNKLKKVVAEYKNTLIENKKDKVATIEGKVEKKENTEPITIIYGKTGIKFECDNVPISIINRVGDLLKEYIVATYDKEGNKIGK